MTGGDEGSAIARDPCCSVRHRRIPGAAVAAGAERSSTAGRRPDINTGQQREQQNETAMHHHLIVDHKHTLSSTVNFWSLRTELAARASLAVRWSAASWPSASQAGGRDV
ncbi:hypothetical protein GCM10023195_69010 [Actinoallomurus liliacearum]|uniref:Uncharacterized protein n=1 Tax=Actinoallomurus liliacearum TaxID=1080073 RepID=A0ABP8TWK7_9ACTN